MSDTVEYRCPHCDAVLDHVVVVDRAPLIARDGKRRHAVDDRRRAAVAVAERRGGVDAVMSDLGVSKSQAYRLIAQVNGTPTGTGRTGRPPTPATDKLAALDAYRSGRTVPEIMELLGKKERTVRRWIADARLIESERP